MTSAPPVLVPLEGAARLWGTFALSAATFMNILDSSIANVSLPAIAGDLGVSPNQGTWVITSFAVGEAIRLAAIGFDAVKLIALARLERRPARLNLAAYPHLPKTAVKTTSAADYAVLLPGAAA